MNAPTISIADSDTDIARCFAVMRQLRPQLSEDTFVQRIRRMSAEKYQLALLVDAGGEVRSVAGFRLMETLFAGQMLYVDDLITDAASRSHGYGDLLWEWLATRAQALGCEELALDSGTQRVDAHRFYFRKRMKITCFHFSRPLKS